MPNTSARACGTKLASCAHCLAFIALRAAATARAAGVESGAASVTPACTVVLGVIAGACVEETLAGDMLVNGESVVEVEIEVEVEVEGEVEGEGEGEVEIEGEGEGAGAVPVTGTKVPSACKTNLAGPVASVVCADAGVAG